MKALLAVLYLLIVIGAFVGWVLNIVSILHSDVSHLTGLIVVRVVGIFVFPIGAVLGWF